jgi:UDP-glucose 4-epimerase
MRNRTCLVVGGNGFIGRNLTQRLVKEYSEVIIYDITKPSFDSNKLKFIEGSIENTQRLMQAASLCHNIVWLVHTSVPASSMYDVESDLLSNIPPLIRFIQLLPKGSEAKKFVYLSSGGTVYGDRTERTPIAENETKDPISSYGLTKLIAEDYLTFIFKRSSISTFILRPSNVYGRYQNLNKPQGIIGHAFKAVMNDQPITIFGDGTITRDYVHVDDLSDAIVRCLKSTIHSHFPLVLNVGSGQETTINNIIDMIASITNLKPSVNRLPERDFDCKFNVLSIQKAAREIGWTPNVELQKGLQDVWDWIREVELAKP